MTTMTQTAEQTVTYEPTIADRINRVLYRLEHTENLGYGKLKYGDKFCILGLFADESGLGSWDKLGYFVDKDGKLHSPGTLSASVMEYYGFKTNNGEYYPGDLSPEDKAELLGLLETSKIKKITLASVNDELVGRGKIKEAKQALSLLIKSGLILEY